MTMDNHRAYIGLGSNLREPENQVRTAGFSNLDLANEGLTRTTRI